MSMSWFVTLARFLAGVVVSLGAALPTPAATCSRSADPQDTLTKPGVAGNEIFDAGGRPRVGRCPPVEFGSRLTWVLDTGCGAAVDTGTMSGVMNGRARWSDRTLWPGPQRSGDLTRPPAARASVGQSRPQLRRSRPPGKGRLAKAAWQRPPGKGRLKLKISVRV